LFAKKCKENGIIFIGPDYETIQKMGDKTAARNIAKELGVPIIPGTDLALKNP
jgi:acetyl/propionyl-CoA carboxylase alpha subunit